MVADTLKIVDVTRMGEGLVIAFSNGTTVLYHPQFLFDVRGQDSNRELPPVSDDDLP